MEQVTNIENRINRFLLVPQNLLLARSLCITRSLKIREDIGIVCKSRE